MSLKEVAGGPSPAAIAETRTAAKEVEGVSNKYAVVDGADQASNEFPYVPFAPDSYDDTAMIKQAFAQPAVAGADNWVVPFESKDAEYVKRQRDQVENSDFDRWIMQKYDLTNPAQMKLFEIIAPDQFKRRMDLIDYEQNLVTKYAKTRLEGPKSMEDLKFEWLVETGRMELPKGPLWDPVAWMGAQFNQNPTVPANNAGWAARALPNNQRFMAGMFSPLSYLSNLTSGRRRNENLADIKGQGIHVEGQIVKGALTSDKGVINRYGDNPIRNANFQWYQNNRPGEYFGRGVNRRLPGALPPGVMAPRKGYGLNPIA